MVEKFIRDYDVQGLAGYSVDGSKYYLDKDTPRFFEYEGKKIPTDNLLLVHEIVEKTLEDHLGYDYDKAHDIALSAERKAAEKQGISWEAYDAFMQQQIKQNEKDEKSGQTDFPPDLEDPQNPGSIAQASLKIKLAKLQIKKVLASYGPKNKTLS